jgi:hypothetical protein
MFSMASRCWRYFVLFNSHFMTDKGKDVCIITSMATEVKVAKTNQPDVPAIAAAVGAQRTRRKPCSQGNRDAEGASSGSRFAVKCECSGRRRAGGVAARSLTAVREFRRQSSVISDGIDRQLIKLVEGSHRLAG